MKKIQYFIAIAAGVLLTATTSCDKEDNPVPPSRRSAPPA